MAATQLQSPTHPVDMQVKLKVDTRKDIDRIPELERLGEEQRRR